MRFSLASDPQQAANHSSPLNRRTNHRNNRNPGMQPASTCLAEQRSPPNMASSALTAGGGNRDNITTPSNSDHVIVRKGSFPLMRLPAELREAIYLFALQPITPVDTAAIPGTPDRVCIPPIAQVSRLLREESLHVLFRNRPVEVSLHSVENLRRAFLWTEKWSGHGSSLNVIIFSGRLEKVEFQFYHITVECSDDVPFFRVRTRPGASYKADLLIAQMKDKVLRWLDSKVKKAKKGQEGRLSTKSIADIIYLIDVASNLKPPEESHPHINMIRQDDLGTMRF